jgi:hypothetical protein
MHRPIPAGGVARDEEGRMLRKSGIQAMAALVLTLLLAGPMASGEAAGWESGKGSGRIWQGLEDLWRWAQEVVSFETADKGISVDPNGATADSDKGSSIDPNG